MREVCFIALLSLAVDLHGQPLRYPGPPNSDPQQQRFSPRVGGPLGRMATARNLLEFCRSPLFRADLQLTDEQLAELQKRYAAFFQTGGSPEVDDVLSKEQIQRAKELWLQVKIRAIPDGPDEPAGVANVLSGVGIELDEREFAELANGLLNSDKEERWNKLRFLAMKRALAEVFDEKEIEALVGKPFAFPVQTQRRYAPPPLVTPPPMKFSPPERPGRGTQNRRR